jgi:transcriptional antiterminator NusG
VSDETDDTAPVTEAGSESASKEVAGVVAHAEPPVEANGGSQAEAGSPAEGSEVPAAEAPKPKRPKTPRGQPVEETPVVEDTVPNWYILKVQSNREDSIADALKRRVKIAGLERYFDEIIVPTEKITEFTKTGKKRVVKRKLYPGYLVVHMVINDDTWFLVRETPGIGDFTGAGGKPVPMLPHEVQKIVQKADDPAVEAPKIKFNFKVGSRVKIVEGTFENFEGEVDAIDETNGLVTVMINIFGRSTPVELEYWQVEAI